MIGNTHFDPVWLWKWDESMSSITATFRSALQRMKDYPSFHYSFATPPVFDWIKNTNPELLEQMKEAVANGQWEIAEGWYLQPDCYTPLGESLVRQGLYGQRYLKQNFGRYSNVVFNIDSFGHPPTLPQILKKSGIDNYVFCRPEGRHIPLREPLFRWISKDGSSVFAYRDDAPYQANTKEAIEAASRLPYDSMLVYGVTDHGGAPTIQSIRVIEESECADFATVGEFFEGRETDYTVSEELLTGDYGVYANHTDIKAKHRVAEYAVLNAERALVIAGSYDRDAIEKCWKDVLFNEFHDILGGASIKEAYTDAENMLGRATIEANEKMHYSLLRVTNGIKMPGKNPDNIWNIVVWNLNASEYDGYIEAEVQWVHEFPWYDKGILLMDEDGNRYECQIIRERSVIPRFRSRFLFKAKIPSIGYRAFKLIKTEQDVIAREIEDLHCIHTKRYTVNFSKNGWIESVFDKAQSRRVASNLLFAKCFRDDGDTWAFNVNGYGEELEPFSLDRLEVVESGGFRCVLKGTYYFRRSKLEVYYTFFENESYMDVRYRVNWNEKHTILKLMTDVNAPMHEASVPYGSICRQESKAELPMGEWLIADDLLYVANHTFSYTMADGQLGLTILRSPIFGDLRLSDIDLDVDYEIMEQGRKEGSLRVYFDSNTPAPILATQFNNPPIVLCEANHDGSRPSSDSFLCSISDGIQLTVMKQAEEGDGIVLRGCELLGKKQKACVRLFGNDYEFAVDPYEIFTVKIHDNQLWKVNMLEE